MVLKDDVGVAKPSTRKLPPLEFAFGKVEKKELGADVICTSWDEHDPKRRLDFHMKQ